MPVRNADAVWEGDLKGGQGKVKLGSGAFEGKYSFTSRFEQGAGTNPEELLAAAHAGCFTMALSGQLGAAGLTADSLETTCTITIEKTDGGVAINGSHLALKAKIPGATRETFDE